MHVARSMLYSEFLGLSRVNITGFSMSRVLEIARLFIYIIHDCCSHMISLVQINT